jgi:hypothetical protein
MTNPNRLAETVAALDAELAETEAMAAKLKQAIAAIREVMGPQHYVRSAVEVTSASDHASATITRGPRPPLRKAILTVLDERTQGEEWSLSDLVWTLAQRGWIGGKDGKPSRESARAVLLALRREGAVERTDTGWRLAPPHAIRVAEEGP